MCVCLTSNPLWATQRDGPDGSDITHITAWRFMGVVISRVISRVTILITLIRDLQLCL